MPVPERIPIKREPHCRTEYAGRWARGQFLGNVISQSDRWAAADGKANWREYSRWFAYLHEFDHDGRYLESTVESPGLGPQARDESMRLLREWLAGIPGLAYGDIAIRPFSAEYLGLDFGLVVEDGHGKDWAELHPDRLGFSEPWNGEYDT